MMTDLTTTVLTLTDCRLRAGRRRLDGRRLTAIVTMLAGAVIGGELILHTAYLPSVGHRARRDHPGRDHELPMRTAGRCADPRAKLYRRRRLQEERGYDRPQNPSGLPDQVHAARRGDPVLRADLRRRRQHAGGVDDSAGKHWHHQGSSRDTPLRRTGSRTAPSMAGTNHRCRAGCRARRRGRRPATATRSLAARHIRRRPEHPAAAGPPSLS